MIRFLRRLLGQAKKPAQMDAVRNVMDRYPNTLRDLAKGEATEESK